MFLGSSARKLKADANLLAGRAQLTFSLSYQVCNDVSAGRIFGIQLPTQVVSVQSSMKEFDCWKVIPTLILEEIQQEALVRNLDSFLRSWRYLQSKCPITEHNKCWP